MSGQSAFPGMSHVLPAFPSPQQLHIPSFSSQHTHLCQIFDLAHHGTAVHTQILGQAVYDIGILYFFVPFSVARECRYAISFFLVLDLDSI